MVQSAVKACPPRKELFERTGLLAALTAAFGRETPVDELVPPDQSQVLVAAFGHCVAGPFVEEREVELSEALRALTHDMFWGPSEGLEVDKKDFVKYIIERLCSPAERASAISGWDHPRVALFYSLVGRIHAAVAEVRGEGNMELVEGLFKKALKTLEAPQVASSGAYSEAVDLTKACLAAVLQKSLGRVSEADQLKRGVKDRRLLEDGFRQRAFILGLEGRVHVIAG